MPGLPFSDLSVREKLIAMKRECQNLSCSEALDRLLTAVSPVKTQCLEIAEACGHVLAEPVKTPRPFPDTRRSAVDGYAVGSLAADDFALVDTLGAEDIPRSALSGNAAAAVMTGATVPAGAQTVVRVEDVLLKGHQVEPKVELVAGANINGIGEEAQKGLPVLGAGERLNAVSHSVLCYLGVDQIQVFRRPRIGILITGNELLRPGQQHRPGMVYECNSYLLRNMLNRMGIDVVVRGPVADSPEVLSKVLDQLAWQNDLVVTSGGVSMGKFDYIRPLLKQSGFELLVDRTKIKPGRPMLVARRDQQLFFGMPGYPAAFLVNLFVYLVPVLRKLCGLSSIQPSYRTARLKTAVTGRTGRSDMIRVQLEQNGSVTEATPLQSQLTSHFINMAGCNGLVVLDEGCAGLAAGTEVQVLDFAAVIG